MLFHVVVQHIECLVVLVAAYAHILLLVALVAKVFFRQLEVFHAGLLGLNFIELEEIVVHK